MNGRALTTARNARLRAYSPYEFFIWTHTRPRILTWHCQTWAQAHVALLTAGYIGAYVGGIVSPKRS